MKILKTELLVLAPLVVAPAKAFLATPPKLLSTRERTQALPPPWTSATRLHDQVRSAAEFITEAAVSGGPLDVRITSAAVLPPLPSDALVDVYYAEMPIKALGTIGDVVDAYHTGIVFSVQDHDPETMPDVPPMFTVEWYALNFPFGAFLPIVNPLAEGSGDYLGLQWENEAHAFYAPICDETRWSKGKTPVGTVSGATLAKYGEWCVEFCAANPAYQAYEVWDRPVIATGESRRWAPSYTCATFAEDSLTALHDLGKPGAGLQEGGDRALRRPKDFLRRSYIPMIARSAPEIVDQTDPEEAQGVRDFYIELSRAARGKGEGYEGGSLNISEFIRLIADRLEFYYIYDQPKDAYFRLELVKPYIALTQLYQPMSLPWQRMDLDGNGVLSDPAGFREIIENESFFSELTGFASEVGGLLKRRLPDILGKKLKKNLTPVLVATAVLLLIAGVEFDIPSFASGTALGVVVGVVGSQLLSKK